MIRFCLLAFLFCHSFATWAMKPMAEWISTPDSLGMKYQTLTLTTPDHLHLAAWLVQPAAAVADQHTVMVLAANDYGNMSYQLYQAHAMSAAGYHVLLFDYRGFGHSDTFAIDPKRLYYNEFATDLQAALAAARQQKPTLRIGILSYSMGTVLATKIAATTKCDFLITDSYVAHPQALVTYYQTKKKTVLLPSDVSAYERVASQVNCPWLLIGGTEDQRTPLADSLAIARAAQGRQRRVVLSVKCDHQGAMEVLSTKDNFGDKYAQAVSQFLAGKPVNISG